MNLFRSHLENWYQTVILSSGERSDVCLVKSGIPQDSISDTIFFSIFFHDLPKNISSDAVILYADDTIVSKFCKNCQVINEKGEIAINQATYWLKLNYLKFNETKTDKLIIENDTEYKRVKLMEKFINNRLNWHSHIH